MTPLITSTLCIVDASKSWKEETNAHLDKSHFFMTVGDSAHGKRSPRKTLIPATGVTAVMAKQKVLTAPLSSIFFLKKVSLTVDISAEN